VSSNSPLVAYSDHSCNGHYFGRANINYSKVENPFHLLPFLFTGKQQQQKNRKKTKSEKNGTTKQGE
jgi:hypothetical protein